MTQYFLVEGGQITVGPKPLPRSWRNFSGLNLLSAEKLAALGWLPQEIVGFTPFDPETQVRTGPVNVIMATKVKSTYTVRDMTAQEQEDKDNQEIGESNLMSDRIIKAFVRSINNGDFVPAQNYTNTQMRSIIRGNIT